MGNNLLNTKAYDPTDAVFGQDLEGNTFHYPLSKGPHWIVAGQTGSGKSVYMNSLLTSIMYHSTPEELVIMAIDPKMVEFSNYKGLPYCPVDPVIDMGDAYGLLVYLVWEMDHRYNKLKNMGVKNIEEFNETVTNIDSMLENNIKKLEKARPLVQFDSEGNPVKPSESGEALDSFRAFISIQEEVKRLTEVKNIIVTEQYKRMPYMVCVIDEYADMVMQEKDVESLIIRLAQKARAAGVHLLIATQRPSADIISPTIKSNVPSRIGLKTTDSMNSMIVIDEPGLEKLKGWGDSIIKLVDGSMVRVQGPYLSNDELNAIFSHLREIYPPPIPFDYKTHIVELGLAEWAGTYDENTPEEEKHVKKAKRKPGMMR